MGEPRLVDDDAAPPLDLTALRGIADRVAADAGAKAESRPKRKRSAER